MWGIFCGQLTTTEWYVSIPTMPEQDRPICLKIGPDDEVSLISEVPTPDGNLQFIPQAEYDRILIYAPGEDKCPLSAIIFRDRESVDPEDLPEDAPSDDKLAELFKAHGITPRVPEGIPA